MVIILICPIRGEHIFRIRISEFSLSSFPQPIITIGPSRHTASSQGETPHNNDHNNSINVLPYDNIQPVTGRPCFAYDIIVHQLGQGELHRFNDIIIKNYIYIYIRAGIFIVMCIIL